MSIRFGPTHWVLWLIFIGLSAADSEAADLWSAETWQRADAFAAVQSVDIDQAVTQIGGISSLVDGPYTLKKLHELETRSDWSLPAREAALYRFTRSLAELPRVAVASGVMLHLRNYQARTLVPHEDPGDALVPLFNIRAAAVGVENAWLRHDAPVAHLTSTAR